MDLLSWWCWCRQWRAAGVEVTAEEKQALETKKKILAMARDKDRFETKHRVRAAPTHPPPLQAPAVPICQQRVRD